MVLAEGGVGGGGVHSLCCLHDAWGGGGGWGGATAMLDHVMADVKIELLGR